MSAINDGGPAFPLAITPDTVDYHGMSLRDWFAGQALVGFIATNPDSDTYEHDAKAAYSWADAMLKAREGAA